MAKAPKSSLQPHVDFLVRSLPFPRKTTIVDVGANPQNAPPYAELLRAGACKVVGFEPLPSAFEILQKSRGPNEVYYNEAVGDGSTQPFHIYRAPSLSSIFMPHVPGFAAIGKPQWTEISETVEMKTTKLDKIKDLIPFDMVKIDTQGSEKAVFTGARRTMKEAVAVIVELRYMQLYEGEPMIGGVDQELRAQGFMLHKFMFSLNRPLPNSQSARLKRRFVCDQLVDGDAVYLRHPGRMDAYSDGQVMHLALLAAEVFASHSLVVYALDELIRRGRIDQGMAAAYVDALPVALRKDPGSQANI